MPEANDINTKKNEVQKKLQNFNENQVCDILLYVADKQFTVDKVTLMKFSPQCATTLREGEKNEIVIPGLKPDAVKWVLNYMHNENISIDEDNAWSILEAASYFQTYSIEKKCCDLLERVITMENSIEVWKKSKKLNCKSILLTVKHLIIRDFERVTKTEGFLNLSKQKITSFRKEFESDIEENLFLRSILQWVDFDKATRRDMVTSMIKTFSPHNVSNNVLKIIKKQKLLPNDADIDDWLIDALFNKVCNHNTNCLFICDRSENKCCTYNISTNRLSLLPQDFEIGWNNLISYNGTIYSVGGYVNDTLTKSMYPFDFDKQKWNTEGVELNIERSSPALVILKDKLYVIAGRGINEVPISECVVFDFATQIVNPIPSLSEIRSECAAVVHEGSIYVGGGYWAEEFFIERFDPRENMWEKMPVECPSLERSSMTIIKDYLYCSNMYPRTRNITYKFDLRARNWQEVPNDDRLNYNNYITSDGCNLYEVGGEGFYKFDTLANSWTLLLEYDFFFPLCIFVK